VRVDDVGAAQTQGEFVRSSTPPQKKVRGLTGLD
jgi:hypothetical protein